MKLTIHTDGGARGNPGPAAIGVVIEEDAKQITTLAEYIGETTNNVAEYTAVKQAFLWILKFYQKGNRVEVHFFLDSLLVVNQLNRIYQIKDRKLQSLYLDIKRLEREWGRGIFYQHIPRSQNSSADFLVNRALDKHSRK